MSGPGPPKSVSSEEKLEGLKFKQRGKISANAKFSALIRKFKKLYTCCLTRSSIQSHIRSARKDVSVHGGNEVESERFDNSWLTSKKESLVNTTIMYSGDGLASILCATQLDLDLETLSKCLGTASLANGGVASAVSRLFLR